MFKRDALTAEDSGELVLRLLREETTASDLSRAASTSDPDSGPPILQSPSSSLDLGG